MTEQDSLENKVKFGKLAKPRNLFEGIEVGKHYCFYLEGGARYFLVEEKLEDSVKGQMLVHDSQYNFHLKPAIVSMPLFGIVESNAEEIANVCRLEPFMKRFVGQCISITHSDGADCGKVVEVTDEGVFLEPYVKNMCGRIDFVQGRQYVRTRDARKITQFTEEEAKDYIKGLNKEVNKDKVKEEKAVKQQNDRRATKGK